MSTFIFSKYGKQAKNVCRHSPLLNVKYLDSNTINQQFPDNLFCRILPSWYWKIFFSNFQQILKRYGSLRQEWMFFLT
jgi:hypothetical protein